MTVEQAVGYAAEGCANDILLRGRTETDEYGRLSTMERIIQIHVEKLPEGLYLATSEDVQGLVAQERTVAETLEIARDVARKLLEAR